MTNPLLIPGISPLFFSFSAQGAANLPVSRQKPVTPLEKSVDKAAIEGHVKTGLSPHEYPHIAIPHSPHHAKSSGITGWVRRLFSKSKTRGRQDSRRNKENAWGKHANCYAYAMDCMEPDDGQKGGAKPGAFHDDPAQPFGEKRIREYSEALIKGAVLDGATPVEGSINAPPAPEEGSYLIALICNGTGFHWMRRDETTRTWSWKDGNGDTVKHNIYEMGEGSFVPIQDGTEHTLATLLNGKEKTYVGWRYGHMRFVSFFRVPNDGCKVAGQKLMSST